MFEADDDITRMVDDLYSICRPLSRGDVLAHDMIEPVLGCKPHEGRWDHVVNRLRRRIRESRGIEMWPVNTVGYRLLTKQEQLEMVPRKRLLRASRQERRARRAVEAIPDAQLSPHQRRLKYAQIETLKAAGRAVRAQLHAQGMLTRRPETNPRPKLAEATA